MAGVIDEFLLGLKFDVDDPDKVVEAYKKIFALQDEHDKKIKEENAAERAAAKERERIEEEEINRKRGMWAKYGIWRKKLDDKNREKKEGKRRFKEDVSKGVDVMKKGVSIARGWAVALLAVDGAAMSVIGKLSQMAVEYQNTATATGTSAAAMKAWEDTVKAAGGSAQDVDSSLSQIYAHQSALDYEGGQSGYASAMGYFGVKAVDNENNQRDTADIFGDLVAAIQKKIAEWANPVLLQKQMEAAGVSSNLLAAIKAKQGGKYMVNQGQYQKYYGRAKDLDALADSSRTISASLTDLGSVIRNKLMVILQDLVNSGVLQKALSDLTKFVEGIDAEKVAKTVEALIKSLERVASWVAESLGYVFNYGDTKAGLEAQGKGSNFFDVTSEMYQKTEAGQQALKINALTDALTNAMGPLAFMGFTMAPSTWKSARDKKSEGGWSITSGETESVYAAQAQKLGLNLGDIYKNAGINVTVNSTTQIDGKDIPSKTVTTAAKSVPGQKPASLQTWGGTK